MKSSFIFNSLIACTILFSTSCQETGNLNKNESKKNDITDFLGHWTIDIGTSQVGWLDVRQEAGYIDADLLWGGGSVLPVPYLYFNEGILTIGRNPRKLVRKQNDDGKEIRVHMFPGFVEARIEGDYMVGHYLTPKNDGIGFDSTRIKGAKLPDVTAPPGYAGLKFGDPVVLFNGDLTGWKLINENQVNGWKVIEGVLVNDAVQKEGEPRIRYGNLRTENVFEDFNLKIDVNVPKGSNSGVYLRGIYEIQVLDSYGKELDSHNMGAVYSRIAPVVSAEKAAGTWQTMDITLCNRYITVILNGTTIIDNQPVFGPTGGALSSDVFAPGPIFLQGDHGSVSYRNIVLTPILK